MVNYTTTQKCLKLKNDAHFRFETRVGIPYFIEISYVICQYGKVMIKKCKRMFEVNFLQTLSGRLEIWSFQSNYSVAIACPRGINKKIKNRYEAFVRNFHRQSEQGVF